MQKLHVVCLDPATGQARAAAQVRVFQAYTHNLAVLWADDENVRLANPVMADTAGRAAFKVIDGDYDLEVSGPGFAPYKLTGVQAADKDNYVTREEFEGGGGGGGGGDVVTVGMLTYVDAKLEFGATGDGATDDWDNIQAAINANRGPVYLRPGIYRISQPITLLDNTTIIGAGVNGVVIRPLTDTIPAFSADSVNAGTIEHLTVESPVLSGGNVGIRFNNSHWMLINDVFVTGRFSQGIIVAAGTGCRVRDVVISNCDTGLALIDGQTTSSVENFACTDCINGIFLEDTFAIWMANILVHRFSANGVICAGAINHLMIASGSFVNNPPGAGNWFGASGTLANCWFVGIAYGNTAPLAAPVGAEYWLMTNNLMLSIEGLINNPSVVKAWGLVTTLGAGGLPPPVVTLGIASAVKIDVGRIRVNWTYPATFIDRGYVVSVTPVNTTAVPIIAQVVAVEHTYADIALYNPAGVFVDGSFFIQATGTVG